MQFPLLSERKRFVVPDVAVAEVGGVGARVGAPGSSTPAGGSHRTWAPRVRASRRKRQPFSPKEP